VSRVIHGELTGMVRWLTGRCSIYDIVWTSSGKQLYLAVFKSGSVGFVATRLATNLYENPIQYLNGVLPVRMVNNTLTQGPAIST